MIAEDQLARLRGAHIEALRKNYYDNVEFYYFGEILKIESWHMADISLASRHANFQYTFNLSNGSKIVISL